MVTISDFQSIITQKNLHLELKNPYVVTVADTSQGFSLVKDILYHVCDKKTMLLLSGGNTPKDLYHMLSTEELLQVGAVGLIDERYGEKMHETSNEQMIAQSGLLGYLRYKHIPCNAILQSEHLSLEDTAASYDQLLRMLLQQYSKSIGILGIGADGHTAGIAPNRNDFNNPLFEKEQKDLFVSSFDDGGGMFKKRVTMTFLGLSMLDLMLVMVFGDEKKEALKKMFVPGLETDIPARFFTKTEIAKKTLIITDQTI